MFTVGRRTYKEAFNCRVIYETVYLSFYGSAHSANNANIY